MKETPNWLIQPEQLRKVLNSSNIQLIDVRSEEDFNRGRIEGAKNIPLASIDSRASKELDSASETIVYCACGITSLEAAVRLKEAGFKTVRSLHGGMSLWTEVYGQ